MADLRNSESTKCEDFTYVHVKMHVQTMNVLSKHPIPFMQHVAICRISTLSILNLHYIRQLICFTILLDELVYFVTKHSAPLIQLV